MGKIIEFLNLDESRGLIKLLICDLSLFRNEAGSTLQSVALEYEHSNLYNMWNQQSYFILS